MLHKYTLAEITIWPELCGENTFLMSHDQYNVRNVRQKNFHFTLRTL